MTLDEVLSNVADQDRGRELVIVDPWTGEPAGIRFRIAGPDSETQRRARIEMMDELAEGADAEGKVSSERREAARLNCLAKCVMLMEIEEGGTPVPTAHKHILRVLRAGTWIETQVDEFAGNRRNFSPYLEQRNAAGQMSHLDLSLRFDAPSDAGEFSGYAVIWDERNAHNERVQRGAFRRTIAEHQRAGTKPLMLWAHDPRDIIGVWDEVREDDKGLFVRGRIILTTTRGREVFDLLKAGAVNGLSLGFRSRGDKRGADGVRVLTDMYVGEISIVGLPSAGNARITSIRSSGRSTESAAAFIEACRKAKCALATQGK